MGTNTDPPSSNVPPCKRLALSFQRTCWAACQPTAPNNHFYKVDRAASKAASKVVGTMNILSYNPGHDGAIAYLQDARLVVSIEAEKNSNYRHSSVSSPDVFNALGELDELPEVICTGGWWPRDHYEYL